MDIPNAKIGHGTERPLPRIECQQTTSVVLGLQGLRTEDSRINKLREGRVS